MLEYCHKGEPIRKSNPFDRTGQGLKWKFLGSYAGSVFSKPSARIVAWRRSPFYC